MLSVVSRVVVGCTLLSVGAVCVGAEAKKPATETPNENKPERLEWFRDQGLGLFIHWSVDSQLGVIISHSLAGASDDYVNRFYKELPKTFNPSHFDPDGLAGLARLAGFRYVMFTTKHHNGFAMWDTKTTDFSITHTPYGKDVTAELFGAFRKQGLATGIYFSPDDFSWLHENGKQIQRLVPEVQPGVNPGLMKLDQQQVTELMTKYGPVQMAFFDGEAKGLRDIVWAKQPDAVVTRGAIETPEQNVPGAPLPGAWEANMTMGTAWGYQPTEEVYKSDEDLLKILIHTRSRGGNLLLNIGPRPDGLLPIEQEERLRTLGLWMFINGEAIYATRPWVVTNEGDLWFTRSKDKKALYVIVDTPEEWRRGRPRDFVLKTVRATAATTASVLGQNDQIVEYRPNLVPKTTFEQKADGLHVHAIHAQRLKDSDRWPYPTVIKLMNVEEAFTPPVVHTLPATWQDGKVGLHASWGGEPSAEGAKMSFQVRLITGEDTRSRLHGWQSLPAQAAVQPGEYSAVWTGAEKGEVYEYRAVFSHPLLTIYGEEVPIPQR
jgi:alpha-L-fucosidase